MNDRTFPHPDHPHYDEYAAARRKHGEILRAACEPAWLRCRAGEITHAEYCVLIEPHLRKYTVDIDPAWLKAGGKKIK